MLTLVLIGMAAMAQDASPLHSVMQAQGIDKYAVSYLDDHGKTMTKKAFATTMMQGREFQITRDDAARTAVLRFNPAGSKPMISAEALAAAKVAPSNPHAFRPGQSLPPFRLTSVNGAIFDNKMLRGHATLINFFFAECAPCIAETPALVAYAKRHPEQSVLAVTFDDADTAKKFVATHGFSWPVLVDGMAFHGAMGVNTYPTMALVGPDGRLVKMALSAKLESKPDSLTVADLERWVGPSTASAQP